MTYTIEAACGCDIGKMRKKNQDNFYFTGQFLEADNIGLPQPLLFEGSLKSGCCFSVFDGMGGERFGEIASFVAAQYMQRKKSTLEALLIPIQTYLNQLVMRLNDAVISAAEELYTNRMGTTMAALFYYHRHIFICNIGDSRVYRLRNGELVQLSQDHVEAQERNTKNKAPLTQNLGIDPKDMLIEPYIAKCKPRRNDWYLLCSDGLTDMLTNTEICDIMLRSNNCETCVRKLIGTALEHGGRDNITAIICKIL